MTDRLTTLLDKFDALMRAATSRHYRYGKDKSIYAFSHFASVNGLPIAHHVIQGDAEAIVAMRSCAEAMSAVARAAKIYRDKVDYTGGDSTEYFIDEQNKLDEALAKLADVELK